MSADLVAGIDLGGTRIKCGLFQADTGGLVEEAMLDTRDGEQEDGLPAFAVEVKRQVEAWGSILAVGIAAPGLSSPDMRRIVSMPGRLQGLEGLDWTDLLGRSEPVPVLNDAHAALWGECWQGAARGLRNVIMLTLGTGVGGAAVVDGRLLRGHLGRAGHFGHICLDMRGPRDITNIPGSLEDAIGACTLPARSGGMFADTQEMLEKAAEGDTIARVLWLRSIHALGCGVASLVNVLDPEAVLFGGGIARAGQLLLEPLADALDAVEWRPEGRQVRLCVSALDDWAGAYGAAYAALNPSAFNNEELP